MKQILTKEDWLKIAKEYVEKGPSELSIELKVSKQRIEQVVSILRKEGIEIPRLRVNFRECIKFVRENINI